MPAAQPELYEYRHPMIAWMKERGFSVAQAADAASIGKDYLYQILQRWEIPGTVTLQKLRKLTGLSADAFLDVPLRAKRPDERRDHRRKTDAEKKSAPTRLFKKTHPDSVFAGKGRAR